MYLIQFSAYEAFEIHFLGIDLSFSDVTVIAITLTIDVICYIWTDVFCTDTGEGWVQTLAMLELEQQLKWPKQIVGEPRMRLSNGFEGQLQFTYVLP